MLVYQHHFADSNCSFSMGFTVDLKTINVASLDASLLIEHLLNASSGNEDTSAHGYNFYKVLPITLSCH